MQNNLSQTIGQFFFSTMSHKIYDLGLYKFVSPVIWKYKTADILNNYKINVSQKHLEIGVGTGYLIRKSIPISKDINLTIMDRNNSCLTKSSISLADYAPQTVQQNILEPFESVDEQFESVGMNYVLHCVHGDFKTKSVVFDHVHSILSEGGVFFGSTLLTEGTRKSVVSTFFMNIFNAMCVFTNNQDSLEDFTSALKSRFEKVEINVIGSAVVWKAIK